MNYGRNVMRAAALTGMMVLGMVQGAGAEDAVDIEELFYTYSSDTQVYDYTESAYLYGWLPLWNIRTITDILHLISWI